MKPTWSSEPAGIAAGHDDTWARVVYRVPVSRSSAPLLRSVLAATAWIALTGCGGHATPEECREILERYIDLSLEADPELQKLPPPQARAVRDMKRAVKLGDGSYQKVELRCEAEVSKKQVRCARDAHTADEWQACID